MHSLPVGVLTINISETQVVGSVTTLRMISDSNLSNSAFKLYFSAIGTGLGGSTTGVASGSIVT